MTSTLTIKDLAATKELDDKTMSAVRGGIGDQSNAAQQGNLLGLIAPVAVGNGSTFSGGPVIFQVDSNPTQTASNDNESVNFKSAWFGAYL